MVDRIEDRVQGASNAQLRQLLSLAGEGALPSESAGEWEDTDVELITILESISGNREIMPRIIQLILDDTVTRSQLEDACRQVRILRSSADLPAQVAAVDILYNAIIASGHVHLGINLGRRSRASRQLVFHQMADQFGPSRLGRLFVRAAE